MEDPRDERYMNPDFAYNPDLNTTAIRVEFQEFVSRMNLKLKGDKPPLHPYEFNTGKTAYLNSMKCAMEHYIDTTCYHVCSFDTKPKADDEDEVAISTRTCPHCNQPCSWVYPTCGISGTKMRMWCKNCWEEEEQITWEEHIRKHPCDMIYDPAYTSP